MHPHHRPPKDEANRCRQARSLWHVNVTLESTSHIFKVSNLSKWHGIHTPQFQPIVVTRTHYQWQKSLTLQDRHAKKMMPRSIGWKVVKLAVASFGIAASQQSVCCDASVLMHYKKPYQQSVVSPLPRKINPDTANALTTTYQTVTDLNALLQLVSRELFHDPRYKLFESPAHREIMKALVDHSSKLQHGVFTGTNGAHTRLLLGREGIGKTYMLRHYVEICQAAFPDVIPVYMTFREVTGTNSALAKRSILQVVAEEVAKRGIAVNPDSPTLPADLSDALQRHDKRVLVLVDEIDELYRVGAADADLFRLMRYSLGDLAEVGDRTLGTIGILICGSSAVCPSLITCHGDKGLKGEFPRLEGAPSLNEQKFRVWHIPAPTPTEITLVRSIMQTTCGKPVTVQQSRLVTFIAGSTPRSVQEILSGNLRAQIIAEQRFPQWNVNLNRTMAGTPGQLFNEVVKALRTKNDALLKSLEVEGVVQPRRVMEIEWEKQLTPLTWDGLKVIWACLCASNAGSGSADDEEALLNNILHCTDCGCLAFDSLQGGAPKEVYPAAAVLLSLRAETSTSWEVIRDTWDQRLQELGTDTVACFAQTALDAGVHRLK